MKLEDANKIYVGSNEVKMIRVGENIIYPKGLVFKNYLENVRESHIDIGFPMKMSYTIEAKLSVTKVQSNNRSSMFLVSYSRNAHPTAGRIVFANIYHSSSLIIGGGNIGWRLYNDYSINIGTPFIVKSTLYPYYKFVLNGVELRNEKTTIYGDLEPTHNSILFRYHYAEGTTEDTIQHPISLYSFLGKCYWCKIWDTDGKLLRDYVPCTYNGENGLWDKVSASFFGNKGLGNFVVG